VAQNKNILLRYKILDKILYRGVAGLDNMLILVNNALPRESSISRRTLINDLENLENIFEIEIVRERNRPYRYRKEGFSIFFNPAQVAGLEEIQRFFMLAAQHPFYKEHSSLLEGFKNILHISPSEEPVILLDHAPYAAGASFLLTLHEAIVRKQPLRISYESFLEKKTHRYIHPYFLKEYRNRWYLYGWREAQKPSEESRLENLALDRMLHIQTWSVPFDHRHRPNTATYFDSFVGVTLPAGKRHIKFEIRFSLPTAQFILSKPLQHSQHLLSKNKGSYVFSYHLIPNFEWEQLILSYGEFAQILSPASYAHHISKRLCTAAKQYGSMK